MLRSLVLAAATLACSASLAFAASPAPASPAKSATAVFGQKQLQDACMKAHPNNHAAFKECMKRPDGKKL